MGVDSKVRKLVLKNKKKFGANPRIEKIKEPSSFSETTQGYIYQIGEEKYFVKVYKEQYEYDIELKNLQEIENIPLGGKPKLIAFNDRERVLIIENIAGWRSLFKDKQYWGVIDNCTCLYDITPILSKKVDHTPFKRALKESAKWLVEYHKHFLAEKKGASEYYMRSLDRILRRLKIEGTQKEILRNSNEIKANELRYISKVHGDYNLGNILLYETSKKRSVCAIDFTLSEQGIPAVDVGSFMANLYHILGAEIKNRSMLMDWFLKCYIENTNKRYTAEILAAAPLYIADHLRAVREANKSEKTKGYKKLMLECLECPKITKGWLEETF